MSKSYFSTHTKDVSVRKEDLERLWEEDRIAIHFPGETWRHERDSESLISAEYGGDLSSKAKGAIRAFVELGEEGGYVWAQSYVSPGRAKVGYVKGRQEGGEGVVMERDAHWELRGKSHPGRKDGHLAVLKTLRMEQVVTTERGQAMDLRAATPRGWAFCRWNVENRLSALVEEKQPTEPRWSRLSTAEQEAACAEFLRERHAARPELPVLSRLLLPVGRTLKDIDVYGLAEDGTLLYAQVTYHRAEKPQAKEKLARLAQYGGRMSGNASLIFFSRGSAPVKGDGLAGASFVSVEEEVMPWILADADHRKALFGVS